MGLKDAIVIAIVTSCIIGGACVGIVGGAITIAGAAGVIHQVVDGGH